MDDSSETGGDPVEHTPPEDDLEAAYRQALEAVDSVQHEVDEALRDLVPEDDETDADGDDEAAHADGSEESSEDEPAATAGVPRDAEQGTDDGSTDDASTGGRGGTRVSARQIVEAALFVGGKPLTTKKLSSLLESDCAPDLIEGVIHELNEQYQTENRPYEIRFGEGGYRMVLKPEFEKERNRVFGLGPKEIRLSQEALEVLSLVAYKQPISKREIEECGKENPGNVLRQLVRRELVVVERPDDKEGEIRYRTTDRFLQLFGLGSLNELPQAEELSLK